MPLIFAVDAQRAGDTQRDLDGANGIFNVPAHGLAVEGGFTDLGQRCAGTLLQPATAMLEILRTIALILPPRQKRDHERIFRLHRHPR